MKTPPRRRRAPRGCRPGGVLLHVGPPKTGTTALQTAWAAAREDLAAQGISYPVRGRSTQHGRAAGALLGRRMAGRSEIEPIATWERLTRRVARRTDRAIVSSELFADLTDEHSRTAVAQLGGTDLRVLITLRPLEALLASVWQQDVKGCRPQDYSQWLSERLDGPQTGPFWLRHAHDRLVTRWAAELGPDRVTVLVVDPRQSERLLRDVEGLAGIRTGTLQPQLGNRSLSAQEAEFLRAFHEQLDGRLSVERYQRWVRLGAFRGLVENRSAGPSETPIATPPAAVRQARDLHRPMVERILASGVNVVGDPGALLPEHDPAADADVVDLREKTVAQIPVDAAVAFALGLVDAVIREDEASN